MRSPLQLIAAGVEVRSSSGIARSVGDLVRRGAIEAGARLPTVRALAETLGVSPSTVSEAWRVLQEHGVISTEGRRGTIVRKSTASLGARHWHVPIVSGTLSIDLSTGTPDSALLPSLGATLSRIPIELPITSYMDRPVIPELEAELRKRWPFPAEVLTVVDGAQDALDRIVSAIVSFGDVVIVEDPSFPPLIDMLELAGAKILGVPLDGEGIELGKVEEALASDPVALFLQPRSHNPTGLDMTDGRGRALAKLFAGRAMVIVEDDHSGDISGAELVSLGKQLPEQVLHIRSFSKSHGPDLRLAAIGGCAEPLNKVIRRRRLGPSWSSRLLQHVLLALLRDQEIEAAVERAGREYNSRRDLLREELGAFGIETTPGSGLNLWVPVAREQTAVVELASHGIGVAPGSPFEINRDAQRYIRVTTASLGHGVREVAVRIAEAAAAESLERHRL